MDASPTLSNPNYVALNDVEGLLIDTEYPKRLAFIAVGREYFGLELSIPEVAWTLGLRREDVISGLNERFADRPLLPGVKRDESVSLGEQILRRRDEIVNAKFANGIDLMPGAPVLITAYADLNVTSGIFTSTKERVIMEMLRAATIPDEFEFGIFGDTPGLKRGKPHADPCLMGAERAGVPPAKCWVIGDSPADIFSADAAGANSIYVPDRRIIAPDPKAVDRATFVVDDLFAAAELVRRLAV